MHFQGNEFIKFSKDVLCCATQRNNLLSACDRVFFFQRWIIFYVSSFHLVRINEDSNHLTNTKIEKLRRKCTWKFIFEKMHKSITPREYQTVWQLHSSLQISVFLLEPAGKLFNKLTDRSNMFKKNHEIEQHLSGKINFSVHIPHYHSYDYIVT